MTDGYGIARRRPDRRRERLSAEEKGKAGK